MDTNKKVRPALPEEVKEALRRFAQDCSTCTDTVHRHLSDLTRRLAGAEAQLASREQELLDTLNRLVDERGTLRGKAEAAEARVRELEAFKTSVMEWAQGRCECCEHRDRPRTCDACWTCTDHEDKPNWTPPQAWGVGE